MIYIIMLKLPTIFFFISFTLLAVVHIIALKLFLYWKYTWFDIPMHILGGIVVALGLYTLNDIRLLVPDRYLRLFPVVLLVLTVGLLWEVFELAIGIPIEEDYAVDTATDLAMGVTGAVFGYIVGRALRRL